MTPAVGNGPDDAPDVIPAPIVGRLVELRPLDAGHRAAMRRILATPEVAERWFGSRTLDEALEELFTAEDQTPLVILEDGEVIGSIQYGEELDPDYRSASIDVFVDPARHGRGLGSDAVAALARHLIHGRGHHRVTIDPAADNERAIRAYRRAGFRPVGILRAHERGRDGRFHDALLMDLLASDLD